MFTRSDYSRKQTLDLGTAMATAVQRLLEGAVFPGPEGVGEIRLASVFSEWPAMEDSQLSPAACVLPDPGVVYDESHPTPFFLDETWEPVGQPGFGLYVLSEARADMRVTFRAGTSAERNALLAGVETLFVTDSVSAIPGPSRCGVLLEMPEYFGDHVRVSLAESLKLDDADSAASSACQFEVTLRAQARHLKLGPVQPFTLRVLTDVTEGGAG